MKEEFLSNEGTVCDCENGIHRIIENDFIPPDCNHNGYMGGKICAVCEKIFEYPVIMPATGHKPVKKPEVAPSCTQEGCKEGIFCEKCGRLLSGGEVIPPTGHIDRDGDGICDICGQKLTNGKPVHLFKAIFSLVRNH